MILYLERLTMNLLIWFDTVREVWRVFAGTTCQIDKWMFIHCKKWAIGYGCCFSLIPFVISVDYKIKGCDVSLIFDRRGSWSCSQKNILIKESHHKQMQLKHGHRHERKGGGSKAFPNSMKHFKTNPLNDRKEDFIYKTVAKSWSLPNGGTFCIVHIFKIVQTSYFFCHSMFDISSCNLSGVCTSTIVFFVIKWQSGIYIFCSTILSFL